MGDTVSALRITLALAGMATPILLAMAVPLAWWLARTRSGWRDPVAALVALPLVLPATVIGFYLLVAMGPDGPFGGAHLVFSFWGILVGVVLHGLPFVVQPLRSAFEQQQEALFDAAATLRAGPLDRFLSISLPMARPALLTAAVMGFAHSVGEFGVVLMIGGNIPGETRTLSVALFDHVEALRWNEAHRVAFGLVLFSFAVIFVTFRFGRR